MVPHRFSINLNKEGYQKIINVRASDNEIHRLYISITNGTEHIEFNNNTVATIYCWKPNGEKVWNNCEISNNEVICDFSGDVLNCCGDIVCELFLSTLGTNIITPKFVLSVESTLPFPHFNLLEEQPENWLDEADLYYIKNENGDFIPVELNANRNLLSDIEFPYNTTIGNIEYRRTKALDFDFNRKLYISYYGSNPDITLRYEFYYSIKGNLTELIESYTSIKKTLEIIVPNITKRQLIEKGYDGIRLVLSIPTNCLTSEYKATDWVLEYDECSYKNCKTPYFEKGKYYIMTNDYGKSGEQYNALIKAITEAREFYNKAISDIKLVDNCLTIDFVNGDKYVSSSLKGNGIKSFAKVSTSGNVDTYEFVADNGEKFSFSVTNTDNSVLEEIKEKLENKVNIDIYNQKIAEIKNTINTLQTKKVGTDDFAKSMSELQSLVAEVKAYAINVNNEKLDISTFDTAVNNINNAITVLENGKVDNGTYADDMNAVNASIDSIVKNANTLLEMIQSNEIALTQKIDTVAIRGADMTTIPTLTTNIQKEGSTLAIYSTKLFSDTPSDTTTFSGKKINEILADKEDNSNKVTTGSPSYKEAQYPSVAYLEKYFYSKIETDTKIGEIINDENVTDKSTFSSNKIENLLNEKVNNTDFDTYKNATNQSILENSIKNTTDKDSSAVLNDSSNFNIAGLALYGNSTQSAVPTPTAPVDIVSVENPQIKFCYKNLFDFNKAHFSSNEGASNIVVDKSNKQVSFTTSDTNNNSGVFVRHTEYGIDYNKTVGKSMTLSFDVVSDVDCDMYISFTSNNFSTTTAVTNSVQRISICEIVGEKTINNALCFYANKVSANITIKNIQIEFGNVATEYEDYITEQKFTANGIILHGIGDVCDTITVNQDGTGYLTQNMLYEKLTSGTSSTGNTWQYSTTTERFYRNDGRYKANYGTPILACSHFEAKDNDRDKTLDNTIGFTAGGGYGVAIRKSDCNGDIATFKSWLDENDVYILIPLRNPVVTELSKEQIDNVLALHTYYPTTSVLSDCNNQLTYVADTKSYIDNKFNELATALVAHESEVN